MDGGGCFMPAVKTYRPVPVKRKKAQRQSLQTQGIHRFKGIIIAMALCVLVAWGYFHGSSLVSEMFNSFEVAFAQAGFKLEDVVVEGRMRTDKGLIIKKLGLTRDSPLLSINLAEAKTKLEELSWIKSVRVERRFPDTLFIRISEKEPVALWVNQAKTYLLDRDGEMVETQESHKYKNLLIVTGHNAPQEIGKLVAILEKFPDLKARVTTATNLRASRWDIRLDDSLDIKLPEKEAERALAYLLDLEKSHHLMEKKIMTIDLRLPGQMILRLMPESVQEKSRTGKDA
jgi:cell division protein FtsQ